MPVVDWESAVDAIAGIGPSARDKLAGAGVKTVADLVWLLPVAWDDLRAPLTIAEATARTASGPERVCVRGVVKSAGMVPMRGRRAVRVVLMDEAREGQAKATTLHAWWFFAAHGVLGLAKPGTACLVVGRVRADRPGKPASVAHPDIVVDAPGARGVRPRYPRLGVAEALLRRTIGAALEALPTLPDPVPAALALREKMPEVSTLLRAAHCAGAAPDVASVTALRERLAWTEAFARVRDRLRAESRQGDGPAPALRPDASVRARLVAELGFALTGAQTRAIDAIAGDLAKTTPMRRLLLGDVGTGKTAVALAAAAQCVAAGWQVALLAPTSLLAEQYMDAAAPLARATRASIALVAAGTPAATRARTLEHVGKGGIGVVIGTHAILEEHVRFARLGLVIVDEQQRLGVAQRLALVEKGGRPHLLTLTATPIPRTLALALRGDLATSVLDERPMGRLPVVTELVGQDKIADVVAEIRAVCGRGERVFFVAPRVEDDDEDDGLRGAIARAEQLRRTLAPLRVALVHGAMPADDKRAAMRAFRTGEASVLVGTTVLEVGVDVPEATLMVIDSAERFGLAQLHQMRGRVGRGTMPGRCLLIHPEPLSPVAAARLRVLCESSDGTAIARADLALRGPGDLSGTRQSGVEADFFFLDPAAPPPQWLARIDADARAILAADPHLENDAHRALALAVARFEAALAVREEAG